MEMTSKMKLLLTLHEISAQTWCWLWLCAVTGLGGNALEKQEGKRLGGEMSEKETSTVGRSKEGNVCLPTNYTYPATKQVRDIEVERRTLNPVPKCSWSRHTQPQTLLQY